MGMKIFQLQIGSFLQDAVHKLLFLYLRRMSFKRKILLDFDEYQMLKKKAELCEKKHVTNETKKLQTGGLNVEEIVAENEYNEGLLQPTSSKTSNT